MGIGDGDWGLGPIPNPQSPMDLSIFQKNSIKYIIKIINFI